MSGDLISDHEGVNAEARDSLCGVPYKRFRLGVSRFLVLLNLLSHLVTVAGIARVSSIPSDSWILLLRSVPPLD
jgi:hypothetical protein